MPDLDDAKQTPLLDLLRSVPEDAVASYEVSPTHHMHIPYGRHCREAAARLTAAAEERDKCRKRLGKAGAELSHLRTAFDELKLAHEAAFTAAAGRERGLRELLQETLRVGAYGTGSTLAQRITAALAASPADRAEPTPSADLRMTDAEREQARRECYADEAAIRAAQPPDADERVRVAEQERDKLHALLNTPELIDFREAVVREAVHQRERWGTDHDGGKTPADWFWLIGYLAGKALHSQTSGNTDKALHHVITTAAACANWHAAMLGTTNMRPGIAPPDAAAMGTTP